MQINRKNGEIPPDSGLPEYKDLLIVPDVNYEKNIPELPEGKDIFLPAPGKCPNIKPYLFFVNKITGERIPCNCKLYSCPVCGPKKIKLLYKGCLKFLEQYKWIRMWTFTMTTSLFDSVLDHYKAMSYCWNKFITEVRRFSGFTPTQQKVGYIRIAEPFQSGFVHYHVLVTEYLPVSVIIPLWERIVKNYLKTEKHCASCWVKGSYSPKKAAHYVCKYITKSAQYISKNLKKYTKSFGIVFFTKKESSLEWIIIKLSDSRLLYLSGNSTTTPLKNDNCSILSPPGLSDVENYVNLESEYKENEIFDVEFSIQYEAKAIEELNAFFSFCKAENNNLLGKQFKSISIKK